MDAGGRTHAFFYDRRYRLICETHPDFGTRAYTLDAAGNRLATSGGGATEYAGYDWDGMGKLRRVQCVGASQERYRADYEGAGDRVRMRLDGIDPVNSYGAGLLQRAVAPGCTAGAIPAARGRFRKRAAEIAGRGAARPGTCFQGLLRAAGD